MGNSKILDMVFEAEGLNSNPPVTEETRQLVAAIQKATNLELIDLLNDENVKVYNEFKPMQYAIESSIFFRLYGKKYRIDLTIHSNGDIYGPPLEGLAGAVETYDPKNDVLLGSFPEVAFE